MTLLGKCLLTYLLIVNLLAFILCGLDKWKAKRGYWRVPERILFGMSFLGGGAAFYFKVLRPKQQKAAAPQEDYGDELTDYDEPDGYGDEDDDGPPWDEEDDDGEEADK